MLGQKKQSDALCLSLTKSIIKDYYHFEHEFNDIKKPKSKHLALPIFPLTKSNSTENLTTKLRLVGGKISLGCIDCLENCDGERPKQQLTWSE